MNIVIQNVVATLISLSGATIWTKCVSHLVNTRRLKARNARKFVHITTIPLFMLTWPFYAIHFSSKLLAASVPFCFSMKIWLNPKKDFLIRSVTRDENLDADIWKQAYGPFAYGLSVSLITGLSWRNHIESYLSLGSLCFGDGFADVIGTWLNGNRIWFLPKSIFWKKKSIQGSIACCLSTIVGSIGMIKIANQFGYIETNEIRMKKILLSGVIASLSECFPYEDNLLVPIVVYVSAKLMK